MNFYHKQHKYYCGIDLHAKSMYLCILNSEGTAVVHRNIRTDEKYFLKVLDPFREDVVVGVECMFSWYWLADLCVLLRTRPDTYLDGAHMRTNLLFE